MEEMWSKGHERKEGPQTGQRREKETYLTLSRGIKVVFTLPKRLAGTLGTT